MLRRTTVLSPSRALPSSSSSEDRLLSSRSSTWMEREAFLRRRVSDLRGEVSDFVEERVSQLISDLAPQEERALGDQDPQIEQGDRNRRKVFRARESQLTIMFQIDEFRTIYNIFVAVFIMLSLQTVYYDMAREGYFNIDFSLITWCFGQLSVTSVTWFLMFVQVLCIYPALRSWGLDPGSSNLVHLGLYVLFQGALFSWPFFVVFYYHLPPAAAMVVTCEQMRFIMKSHAFAREVMRALATPRIDPQASEESLSRHFPPFGKYLYFLFAPTLIYRDNYPRTPTIRWNLVFMNFGQVFFALFYTYYIFARYCVPEFKNSGAEGGHGSVKKLLESVFLSMLPGTVVLLLGFYAILHSWLNAFAELLQFADRQFYKDWWNQKSFAAYYRTWNVVVHDWLFNYIYMEFRPVLGKTSAMLIVFTVSSILHEYVILCSMGFFFPVMLVMFGGVGVWFIYLTRNQTSQAWNVFMWLMLFFGNGLLMCLYSTEWYARKHLCGENCSVLDHLTPFSLKMEWTWE